MRFSGLAASRDILLIRLTCLFWLIAKIISWKLWLSNRIFPLVPAVAFLAAPSYVHLILFVFSLIALLILLFYPAAKALQISLIIIETLSCILDQNRWQPWEYQYLLMLFIFIINRKNEKYISAILGFMIASVYFYSGLSKLNPVFLQSVWYKIILNHLLHVNTVASHRLFIYHAGYILGLIEISLGIGLFFNRTKKISGVFIILMHLLILLIFGPLGINYDTIIWPWNVAMIFFVLILIVQDNNFSISFKSLFYQWNKLFFILFGIMPMLNLFGYWDFFFSSSLFSSRPPDMYICVKNNSANKILEPYYLTTKTSIACDSNSSVINVRGWAFDEMLAPGNPEIRIYKSIKTQLEKDYPGLNARFIIAYYKNGKKITEELK